MAYHAPTFYPFATEKLQLSSGEELAYIDEGPTLPVTQADRALAPVVFIHGLSSYLPVWSAQLLALAPHRRVIAMDLPGYGKSSAGPYASTPSYYAEVVAQLLQHLKVAEAVLVGHSMGGQVAQVFALRYPYRVQRLVLAAPAGFEHFTEKEQKGLEKHFDNFPILTAVIGRLYSRALGKSPVPGGLGIDERQYIYSNAGMAYAHTLARCIKGMLAEPVYDYLEQLRMPTLVVFGDADTLIPNRLFHRISTSEVAEAAIRRMPQAQLQLLPGIGHFVQLEAPLLFTQYLMQFLGIVQ